LTNSGAQQVGIAGHSDRMSEMGHQRTFGRFRGRSVHPSITHIAGLAVGRKLSPEGEVIAAYGAAMVAAFQVLINCREENDAVLPGQFPDALRVYMEMVKSKKGDVSDMTLAVLHDIRTATQD